MSTQVVVIIKSKPEKEAVDINRGKDAEVLKYIFDYCQGEKRKLADGLAPMQGGL